MTTPLNYIGAMAEISMLNKEREVRILGAIRAGMTPKITKHWLRRIDRECTEKLNRIKEKYS